MWGNLLKISIFGGSHTEAIGAVIDGLPAGETIDFDKVMVQMARRAPGNDKTATTRKEADVPQVVCGISDEGILSGDPVCALIHNTSQRSKDYSGLKINPRPGHADFTAYMKYKGCNDVRGGGHFSGRLTAPLVFAGALCRQVLERHGIVIGAHVYAIGKVKDDSFGTKIDPAVLNRLSDTYFPALSERAKEEMYDAVEQARLNCDSIGGIVECAVTGLPVGLGSPMFDGVENVISSIVFGIPAVKGIEFGSGFAGTEMRGSENNDAFYYDGETVKTRTNNSGGILGGITNGMPLVFRTAMKPTPSIATQQQTVNLQEKQDSQLAITGRHDPCIVPRAVPAVEAAAAVAVTELLLKNGMLG